MNIQNYDATNEKYLLTRIMMKDWSKLGDKLHLMPKEGNDLSSYFSERRLDSMLLAFDILDAEFQWMWTQTSEFFEGMENEPEGRAHLDEIRMEKVSEHNVMDLTREELLTLIRIMFVGKTYIKSIKHAAVDGKMDLDKLDEVFNPLMRNAIRQTLPEIEQLLANEEEVRFPWTSADAQFERFDVFMNKRNVITSVKQFDSLREFFLPIDHLFYALGDWQKAREAKLERIL